MCNGFGRRLPTSAAARPRHEVPLEVVQEVRQEWRVEPHVTTYLSLGGEERPVVGYRHPRSSGGVRHRLTASQTATTATAPRGSQPRGVTPPPPSHCRGSAHRGTAQSVPDTRTA